MSFGLGLIQLAAAVASSGNTADNSSELSNSSNQVTNVGFEVGAERMRPQAAMAPLQKRAATSSAAAAR